MMPRRPPRDVLRGVLRKALGDEIASALYGWRLSERLRGGSASRRCTAAMLCARKLLSRGDVAVDVGALGADWTCLLAGVLGPTGTVLAVEADPFFARVIECAFKRVGLSRIVVMATALGDANGRTCLRTVQDGTDLRGYAHIHRTRRLDEGCISVPIATLDSVVEQYPVLRKARLIKIDVEGYELHVLRGSGHLLKSARPLVVCEVAPRFLRRSLREWIGH